MIHLPTLNAILNSLAFVFIVSGIVMIKRRNIGKHRMFMILATLTSVVFLVSYLIYHYSYPMTTFSHEGVLRIIYYSILISHIILAVAVVPMVIVTVTLALRNRLASHRRWARWTYPTWSYVSVTGVIVYLMLYQL